MAKFSWQSLGWASYLWKRLLVVLFIPLLFLSFEIFNCMALGFTSIILDENLTLNATSTNLNKHSTDQLHCSIELVIFSNFLNSKEENSLHEAKCRPQKSLELCNSKGSRVVFLFKMYLDTNKILMQRVNSNGEN